IASFNMKFFFCNKFDCLGIGCLVGYLYAEGHKWLRLLYNKWLFVVSLVAVLVFWGANIGFPYFTDEFMALLFAIVILNICTNPNLNINIENAVTKFLGKISYGIYMYHWIVLLIAFELLPLSDNWYSTVILYLFVLGGAILVAWLSFISYEKFFLNFKKRFEK
ncbi:MAG: acyltransferase, partial [Paludibacteraceae bacterium]|nr:acyltransferase [Paludibacteraceae bacterium]